MPWNGFFQPSSEKHQPDERSSERWLTHHRTWTNEFKTYKLGVEQMALVFNVNRFLITIATAKLRFNLDSKRHYIYIKKRWIKIIELNWMKLNWFELRGSGESLMCQSWFSFSSAKSTSLKCHFLINDGLKFAMTTRYADWLFLCQFFTSITRGRLWTLMFLQDCLWIVSFP